MIVQANRIYNLKYGGRVHRIKRKDLTRLNNRLASTYKRASEEQRRTIQRIILELNDTYISNAPYRFINSMEREDWLQEVYRHLPQALQAYDEHKGDFIQYFVAWKRAAFNRWMDKRDTVYLPANQRLTLNQLNRKIAHGKALTEAEKTAYDSIHLTMNSLDAPLDEDGGTVMDAFPGTDLRETAFGTTYEELWHRINMALPPEDFRIMRWYLHDDYKLNYREIGERLGISHEAVRLRIDKIMPKVRRAMSPHRQDLKD